MARIWRGTSQRDPADTRRRVSPLPYGPIEAAALPLLALAPMAKLPQAAFFAFAGMLAVFAAWCRAPGTAEGLVTM